MNHLVSTIVKPLIPMFLGLVFTSIGSADILLTGITLHQTSDSTGAYAGGHYDTVGVPIGSFNLYVDNGAGGFVNSGNGAGTAIGIPLVSGTNTFNLYEEGSIGSGLVTFNLFFGAAETLDISALTTVDVAAAPTAVAAGVLVGLENVSGTPLPVPTGPAPGSLSFIQGSQLITLTSVEVLSRAASLTDLPTGDRVSPRDSVPDGTDDGRVRFTLEVSDVTSPVPEPSLVILTGLGFALLAFKTRR